MEEAKSRIHDAVGAIANKGLDWLGRPILERRLAEAFAKKLPIPGDEAIDGTVHGLRIIGIWVCATAGRNLLVDCPCFRTLAKEKTAEELKTALAEKLDAIAADYLG